MRQLLEKEVKKKQIKKSFLARQVGVAPSSITNFFNHKQEPDFETTLGVIRYICPEKEEELMGSYFKEITKTNNIIPSLEYVSTHRMMDDFKLLLQKAKSCKHNKELKDIIPVYEIQYKRQNGEYKDLDEFIYELHSVQVECVIAKVLKGCLESYYYHNNRDYRMAEKVIKSINRYISEISQKYLQLSYLARFNQMQSYIFLLINNDPIVSRKLAQQLINANIGQTYQSYGYYILGLSYFKESYEQCLKYINKSMQIYKDLGRLESCDALNNKILLLNMFYGKISPKEAYNRITYTEHSPERFYIKGIIEDSVHLLRRSMIRFVKIGDIFLSDLPKFELLKRGVDIEELNDLQSII